jgi:ankyrin repeat protein
MATKRTLLDAIFSNDLALLKQLLDRGADPNALVDKPAKGLSPLIEAARCGTPEIITTLLDRGADIHQTTGVVEDSPLSAACARGRIDVVKLFLDRGADPNLRLTGASALTAAMIDKQPSRTAIVKMLLAAGADPAFVFHSNAGVPVGDVLMRAAGSASCAALKLLLSAGVEVNRQFAFGTALTSAVSENRVDVVELLLANGADPMIRVPNNPDIVGDAANKTALEIAQAKRYQKVVKAITQFRPA